MITLEFLLELETKEDINAILDLMRRFSSVMRYAYKRLLEGEKRKDFCCLEKSYRDFSPLKRVIISKDWIVVAYRLVPMLGIGDYKYATVYDTSKIPPVGVGSV